MVAAARKNKRVVQVGTQRRSTPHLIEARDRVVKEGKLGKVGLVEVYCYYHMRANGNPPDTEPPEYLDYEMWTGPAPMRPYNQLVHPRSWRAFMEYGNGIMGDMCIHMLDMVRWMLDLGWPKRISSSGGILVDKASKANIADTQTATFDFGDLQVVWQHRTWGDADRSEIPLGRDALRRQGHAQGRRPQVRFHAVESGQAGADRQGRCYEYEKYPEGRHREGPGTARCPGGARAHADFLKAIASRGKPVADIEEGHISTASCILANLSMKLGRSLTWDAEKQRVVGDEEANKLLRRPYRKPWVHPV